MKPFIYEARNGVHLIDLEHTHRHLQEAGDYLKNLAKNGDKILFVGCKKPAQSIICEAATAIGCSYVADRWLGGTLTNLSTIRKSVRRLEEIEKMEKSGELDKLPRKEGAAMRREKARLIRNLVGIRNMEKIPAAIVMVDTVREQNALSEAKRLNIPVIAITDTNANPEEVEFPVAGNDDAIRSIKILINTLAESYATGLVESGRQIRTEKTDKTEEPAPAVATA